MERQMVHITLRQDKKHNYQKQDKNVKDILEKEKESKWRWPFAGHVARFQDNRDSQNGVQDQDRRRERGRQKKKMSR